MWPHQNLSYTHSWFASFSFPRAKFRMMAGMSRRLSYVSMNWPWWTATISLATQELGRGKPELDALWWLEGTTDWVTALVDLVILLPSNPRQLGLAWSWNWPTPWLWTFFEWQVSSSCDSGDSWLKVHFTVYSVSQGSSLLKQHLWFPWQLEWALFYVCWPSDTTVQGPSMSYGPGLTRSPVSNPSLLQVRTLSLGKGH